MSSSKDPMRLTCLNPETKGPLTVTFHFGAFEHPIYGKWGRLTGSYQLFNTGASYPMSNYFELSKEEQDKILKSAAKRYRYLAPDYDDEDLFKQVFQGIVATALCCPRIDVHSEPYDITVEYMGLACYTDDSLEDHVIMKDASGSYRMHLKEVQRYEQNPKPWKEFLNDDEEFKLITKRTMDILPDGGALVIAANRIRERIKGLYDNEVPVEFKYVMAATGAPIEGGLLTYKGEGDLPFSERALQRIRGYEAGMGSFLEMAALLQKFPVPLSIRSTVAFGLLQEGVRDFGGLSNDIVGLAKDVYEEATYKNIILRRVVREGISLEQGFNDLLKDLKDVVQDLGVIMQFLLDTFPDDKGLAGYIDAAKTLCDGQTIGYVLSCQHKGRYVPKDFGIEVLASLE